MTYRPEIDGLRAIAILPVVFFHAGVEFFDGGFAGVDIFFVISGYLITSLIIVELDQGRFSLIGFYERRARRILPALFFVMLCSLPFAWLSMLPAQLMEFSRSLVAASFFFANIFFSDKVSYFDNSAETRPFLHAWSLSIEEQFYILFPILLLTAFLFGRRYALGVVSIAAVVIFGLSESVPYKNFYLIENRAWELLAGSTCAFLQVKVSKRLDDGIALLGLVLILYSLVFFHSGTPTPSLFTLLPVLGTALVILFAKGDALVAKLLSRRLFVGIGLISYSLYLWHQPVFAFYRLYADDDPTFFPTFALTFLTIALSVFSWKFVEQPFRSRAGMRPADMKYALVPIAVLAVASLGIFSRGGLDRFPAQDRHLASIDPREVGKYISANFRRARMKDFPENAKENVLVIGDSFAMDFVNALHEASLDQEFNLSTYHISSRCGNLLTKTDIGHFIEPAKKTRCAGSKGYDDERLRALLEQSDRLFLVSNWQEWQLPFLPESVENLEKVSPADIIVVGRKNFGDVDLKRLLNVPYDERLGLKNPADPRHVEINEAMKRQDIRFFDMHDMICDSKNLCPLFDEKGHIFSHDGVHLTPSGAAFLGELLKDAFGFQDVGWHPRGRALEVASD